MGTTLRVLGRHAEAIEAYERYRSEPGADPKRLAEVERELADLYPRVAGVTVFVDDDQATALLDGGPLASLDGSRWIWLEPGEHVLLVERAGRPTITRVLRVQAGERNNLVIELGRPPTLPLRRPVELRTAAAGLGVAGGVGVAVGAGLGVVALVLDGEASDHCLPDAPNRCDATGASFGAYAHGLETAAIVSLVTASTLGAVGLTLYLASPATAGAAAPAIAPSAHLGLGPGDPTGSWLRVRGRF